MEERSSGSGLSNALVHLLVSVLVALFFMDSLTRKRVWMPFIRVLSWLVILPNLLMLYLVVKLYWINMFPIEIEKILN